MNTYDAIIVGSGAAGGIVDAKTTVTDEWDVFTVTTIYLLSTDRFM